MGSNKGIVFSSFYMLEFHISSCMYWNKEAIYLTLDNSFQNFFRLSPGFCFADGLASLALLRQGMKTGSDSSAFDWNVTGASICYLAAEVLFFS